MKIELSNEELHTLSQMVLLGEYVITSCPESAETTKKCSELANSLYRKLYKTNMPDCDEADIEDNEIADVRDSLYDGVKDFLEQFEEDVYREKCDD